jgi:hypothetical protein
MREICIVGLERSMGFSSAPMVLVKIGYVLHVEARLAYRTAAELLKSASVRGGGLHGSRLVLLTRAVPR